MATFVPLIPIPIQLQDSTTSVNMSSGTLEFFLSGTSTPTNLFSNNTGTSIGNSITLNAGGYPESGGNVITLFRDASIALKIVGKNAAGSILWTADKLEDSLVILASTSNTKGASLIGVEDAGTYFADSEVEAVLQDIGNKYLKTDRADIISADLTFASADIKMADNVVERPEFKDYSLTHNTITSSSNAITADCSTGNSFYHLLTENTTFTLSNPSPTGKLCQIIIRIKQDGAGGQHTVTWPGTVTWGGGSKPVVSIGNDAIDKFTRTTDDAGTLWFGEFAQAYAAA